jgi:hypothetical protein
MPAERGSFGGSGTQALTPTTFKRDRVALTAHHAHHAAKITVGRRRHTGRSIAVGACAVLAGVGTSCGAQMQMLNSDIREEV